MVLCLQVGLSEMNHLLGRRKFVLRSQVAVLKLLCLHLTALNLEQQEVYFHINFSYQILYFLTRNPSFSGSNQTHQYREVFLASEIVYILSWFQPGPWKVSFVTLTINRGTNGIRQVPASRHQLEETTQNHDSTITGTSGRSSTSI